MAVGGFALTLSAESVLPGDRATNVVPITSALINRLVAEARTNNPALQAAHSRADAANWNIGAVRAWEDPMVRLGRMGARTDMRADDGDVLYGIEQKLPLFGKPQLARRVAEAEASVQLAEAGYRYQLLRRDVVKALMRAALAERVVEVGEQDLTWLETMVTTAEAKYRSGQSTLVEVLQLQNEKARRADRLRTDRSHIDNERLTLNRLLNRQLHAPWPALQLPPIAPSVSYAEKLATLAATHEPKLKVMQQEIKQAEAMARLTRRQRLPDFSVGLEGRNFSGDGDFRQGMLTLSFNVPWGNRDKYRHDFERDQARLKSTELERADYELSVRQELHHLAVNLDAARREALLYRDEIVPRTQQALNSALANWEANRGMLRDALDARRMLLEGQLMSARAAAEQHQMLAELLLFCGLGDLETLQRLVEESAPATNKENSVGNTPAKMLSAQSNALTTETK